ILCPPTTLPVSIWLLSTSRVTSYMPSYPKIFSGSVISRLGRVVCTLLRNCT
ncbi:hypothetical protein MKW92_026963, partial [Papaver armeniacum]